MRAKRFLYSAAEWEKERLTEPEMSREATLKRPYMARELGPEERRV